LAYVIGSRENLMIEKLGQQEGPPPRESVPGGGLVERRLTLGELKAQERRRRSEAQAAEKEAGPPAVTGEATSSTTTTTRKQAESRPRLGEWLRDHECLEPGDVGGELSAALLILWEVDHGVVFPVSRGGGWKGRTGSFTKELRKAVERDAELAGWLRHKDESRVLVPGTPAMRGVT